jgi:hypothetical protein
VADARAATAMWREVAAARWRQRDCGMSALADCGRGARPRMPCSHTRTLWPAATASASGRRALGAVRRVAGTGLACLADVEDADLMLASVKHPASSSFKRSQRAINGYKRFLKLEVNF